MNLLLQHQPGFKEDEEEEGLLPRRPACLCIHTERRGKEEVLMGQNIIR